MASAYNLISVISTFNSCECSGIDVDPKNYDGQTPLLLAAEDGREAVMKLLLEYNSIDVNSNTKRHHMILLAA